MNDFFEWVHYKAPNWVEIFCICIFLFLLVGWLVAWTELFEMGNPIPAILVLCAPFALMVRAIWVEYQKHHEQRERDDITKEKDQ